MKKLMMVVIATLLLVGSAMAQNQTLTPEERAQRQAVKMENRTTQLASALALDDATAARFVEVYKQYHQAMADVHKQYKMHRPKRGNVQAGEPREELTDEQVEANIRARFAMSRAIVDVREKYYNEFRAFMNPKQIQKLYALEKKQGEQMQSKHRKQHPQQGHPQGKPAQAPRR